MNTFTLIKNCDIENLRAAIQAVEENCDINDAQWKDFADAEHIAATYDLKLDAYSKILLEQAIKKNSVHAIKDKLQKIIGIMCGTNYDYRQFFAI
jgi:predicted GNAT family N-acyltransferase